MLKKIELVMLIGPLILFGCAGSSALWSSSPTFKALENPYFRAFVKPKRNVSDVFTMFHLEVTNRSDENLAIDWNESQYLFQGEEAGPLVPIGIDPRQVRKGRIPLEKIVPGQTIAKNIGPLKFAYLIPLPNNPPEKKQPSITFGPLPAGYNGVQLVIHSSDKAIVEALQMRLSNK
jgi:hypothetical protein